MPNPTIVPAVWEREHAVTVTFQVSRRKLIERYGNRLNTVSGMLAIITDLTRKVDDLTPPF